MSLAFAYPKISEEILGARFSSNGLWPDKSWRSKTGEKGLNYLDGYWDIQKVDIDDVSTRILKNSIVRPTDSKSAYSSS